MHITQQNVGEEGREGLARWHMYLVLAVLKCMVCKDVTVL